MERRAVPLTGWRDGCMCVPCEIVRTVECLSQNIALSVNALSQHAGIAAFDATEDLETVKARYAANRDLLLKRLPEIGPADFSPRRRGLLHLRRCQPISRTA